MAAAAIPAISSLASSLFGGIFGGNKSRRVGEDIANTQFGTAQDILNATGAGQGMVAQGGNNAIDKVNASTQNANDTLTAYLQAQLDRTKPFEDVGRAGIDSLLPSVSKPTSFTIQDWINDPGFKFLMEQGNSAINNSAAARGIASSGNTAKELTRFGQGLAATEYDNAFNRYLKAQGNDLSKFNTMANIGLAGTSQSNAALGNAGSQISTNLTNAGRYGGDVDMNVAQFLANLGLQGTKLAGDYRIAGAQSRGAGLLGQSNALTSMVNQLAQVSPQIYSQPKTSTAQTPPFVPQNLQFPWVTS